mgnify:CR=1 FL=1
MTRPSTSFRHPQRGQVLILLVVVLVILTVVGLWNFDLHKIFRVKHLARNGGDAAALAAARWQAISLNLIGELNLVQAALLADALDRGLSNSPLAEAVANLQGRLCLAGPITGLAAAQLAAKNNGIHVHPDFTRALLEHAALVRREYPIRYTPPYETPPGTPGAWEDYADMLTIIGQMGIAADPENRRLYTDIALSDHFLLNPAFYDAIASRDWCWFYFHAMSLLQTYRSWRDWPPLPLFDDPEPINSEYFGLGLRTATRLVGLPASGAGSAGSRATEWADRLSGLTGWLIPPEIVQVETRWFCYRESDWFPWTDRIPEGFPFIEPVRDAFNVAGADAAVRIEATMRRLSPGAGKTTVGWTAAAKPFGSFGDRTIPPNRYGLVLPAFHDVRLIPVDTSSAPGGGSRPGWGIHIRLHLGPYLQQGPSALSPHCWYCDQLRTWEEDAFRQEGLNWLRQYSHLCRLPQGGGGGGGGGSGGTRRGH